MKTNGIQHIRVAPYHPRSNGMAERFVQTFKTAMKKMVNDGEDVNQKLDLLIYRKTPQSTTMQAPAMLLTKQIPRSRIDLLTPDLQKKVNDKQQKQKKDFDRNTRMKTFGIEETVWVRNYRGEKRWISGIILKRNGPLSYELQVADGLIWRRHADQLRHRTETAKISTSSETKTGTSNVESEISEPDLIETTVDNSTINRDTNNVPVDNEQIHRLDNHEQVVNRRSSRNSRLPERLTYYQRGTPILN